MTAQVPIWLLDVDGVLNAIPYQLDKHAPDGWDDYRDASASPDGGRRYPIRYSPSLMQRIRTLHESGAVEVRWLTTWGSGANDELRELLDLPEFKVVAEPYERRGYLDERPHEWWKFDAARRAHDAEPERPIIWTDDDLAMVSEALRWSKTNGFLAVSTHPGVGITPVELTTIMDFIDAAHQGEAPVELVAEPHE